MMERKYIGSGQTAVMLLIFGVFSCIAGVFADTGRMLSDIAVAALYIAVLVIPLVLLMFRESGSISEIMSHRLGIVGRVLSLLYAVYFISAASDFMRRYSEFAAERYYREATVSSCIIIFGIVCIYTAHTGMETVCRMSTVILFGLIITSLFFAVNGFDEIASYDTDRIILYKLSFGNIGENMFLPIFSAGAACLCVLCSGTGKRLYKGAFGGIAAMMAAAAAIVFSVSAVLEEYLSLSEYPMLESVIYVSRELSFRPDGMFFIIWTLVSAAAVSLLCAAAAKSLKVFLPQIKREGIITGGIAVITALVCNTANTDLQLIYGNPVSAAVIIAAIPTILLMISFLKKGGKDKKNSDSEAVQ